MINKFVRHLDVSVAALFASCDVSSVGNSAVVLAEFVLLVNKGPEIHV
jgi:hypothetical protein